MAKLILLRHAKSSWENPSLDDHARPLNARGRDAARKIGRWLQEKGHLPSLVLCSDAARTRETWAGLGLKAEVCFEPKIYHTTADHLQAVISAENTACLMIIGHNPEMAELAKRLAQPAPPHPQFDKFPTAAVLVLEDGAVVDFAVPREL